MTGKFSCINFVFLFLFYWCTYVVYYMVAWMTGLEVLGIQVPGLQENAKRFMDETNMSAHFNYFGNCSNNTFEWKDVDRATWGLLPIGTTFIPGVLFSIANIYSFNMGSRTRLCKHLFSGDTPPGLLKTSLISLGLILFYPVYISFLIGKCLYYQSEKSLKNVQTIIALESFFVYAPQILIQVHIVCSGRVPTTLSILFFLLSLIRFGKAAVEFHIGPDTFRDMGFGHKCFTTLKLLPLFGTCILFRMGSLLVLFTHVNAWALCTVFVMFLLVGIIARKSNFTILQSFLAGPINLCTLVPNINIFTGGQEQQDRRIVPDQKKLVTTANDTTMFYKKSSLAVFIVYTISIIIFIGLWTIHNMGLINEDTDWFEMTWWNKKIFYFDCGEKDIIKGFVFYVTCGLIIVCGLLNLFFLFLCGTNCINPEKTWIDVSSLSNSVDDKPSQRKKVSHPELMQELSSEQSKRKILFKSIRKTIRQTGNKHLINLYRNSQDDTLKQEEYTTFTNQSSPSVGSSQIESNFPRHATSSSRETNQRSGVSSVSTSSSGTYYSSVTSSVSTSSRGTNQNSVPSSVLKSSRGTNQISVPSSVSASSKGANRRHVEIYTMSSLTSDEESRGSVSTY